MAYEEALTALADPTRRKVFEHLRAGPRAVGEIACDMPVSRPAVSQHLKVLKLAGLVADRAEGTRRVYYIDPNGLGALRRWLDQFWDQALAAFQAEVDKAGEPPPAPTPKGKTHESYDHGRARPQKRTRQRRTRPRF
ncbi:MAG TPA: metalloregulator ArsR/SmtB family transcription factor [Steroidobacteraceae bacterium]|nr:metalloregulator ArsR/SmtB family transcription factor [Steroidobacteraceae bacterium]